MTTHNTSIEQHPDILALRAEYEVAAESVGAQAIFGLALLAGLYAAISPWVIGFDTMATRLTVSNLIVGIAVAMLATGFGWALDRTHGLTWTMPVLGIWIIISLWVINPTVLPTPGMVWSNCWAGGVITVLGLAAAYFGVRAPGLAPHGALRTR